MQQGDPHRRLWAGSAVRTVVLYSGLVALVALFPGALCGALGLFLLFFYRREVWRSLRWCFRRGPVPAAGPRWPMALPVEEVNR